MSDAKLTFFQKNPTECPVCGTSFYREELYTGRGRLIAGELTDELRRLYEPSRKFGEICPLVYTVTVCPVCLFAAYHQDFQAVPAEILERLERDRPERERSVRLVFETLDFSEPRTLAEGAASFYLAMSCYDRFPARASPTFKRAVSALRAAWLCSDLHRMSPEENYDYLEKLFYHKARFFYTQAVENEQNGEERIESVQNFGPDVDKNYGYDGLLYITGLLEFKYGTSSDPDRRRVTLESAKRTVSKIFGMGKASKERPSAILEAARSLFGRIAEELKEPAADAT